MKIKNLSVFILAICLPWMSTSSFAGNGPVDPMKKGTWTLNVGFGPGTNWHGSYGSGFIPAGVVSFETGLWDPGPGVITLGGEFGGKFFTYKGTDSRYGPNTSYTYHYADLVFAVRAAYHIGWNVPGLDTYGGVAAGPRFTLFTYELPPSYTGDVKNKPATVGFGGGPFVGASYYFTDFMGVYGEFGFNITYAQVGLVFILK